ncbi:maltose ABC transporter permease MalF [Aggregatibacter actinomycetemcomitans]|uniref:maltose ABC transporter permease MalF n=1 Tax=Aggregatibacter actinomycetemcomitans TaxID=714 RepID=UPI00077E7A37|nr:maltose ABC transporter permease MalF [Aggregatibacter actinomycetemcomitans]KYK75063.1 maltose transporter membrane protein [Aggregatibacter actinomycetemcomitans serotype e str. SA3096]KYK95520.1 maltose transporter membrane protein [Aggregatibacter actinomycetemcomitans serotype e str. ANH9776]TYB21833.1 maltose ABC transporter permease MalF [Aggregatibacter actinomycetemcomitans]
MQQSPTQATSKSPWLKYLLAGVVLLIDLYLVVLMYSQGEYLFAILTLVILTSGVYIFSSKKVYAWRYVYPGLTGMAIFILFPLVATIAIAFTNYSGTNQLSFERAVAVLGEQRYFASDKYDFKLYPQQDNSYILALRNNNTGQDFASVPIKLADNEITVTEQAAPQGEAAPLKVITQNRSALQAMRVTLPSGNELTMSSLRQFSEQKPRYTFNRETNTLTNNENGKIYKANNDIGFFQAVNETGEWLNETLEPGYTVSVGWLNFVKIFTDEGIQKPFIQIFIWTVIFSLLTVVFTVILGMVLACVVQWEALKGKGVYRLLLILPYAVPSFISILIFKGLFNQSFGEINVILNQLFGISPEWFNDPFLAKTMILIVNTWLGYPYMMILCMGLLKAIPSDLYEASAMDGASTWQNFSKITFPLLLKPLTPLMIASFAFNFNNFVLIQLLTNGRPDMIGTTTPAGYTDLLVSYTYRIAFEGSGTQDFGLAAAIATIIFLLVGGLALLNIKATKMKLD